LAPSIKRFQVVTTTSVGNFPFSGISQEQLNARFDAMTALWTKAITAMVPKDKWGVRITKVGGQDVRRARHLSAASKRLLQNDIIDVEVEFKSVNICESDDGCSDSDVDESLQEGLTVLSAVTESVRSGALIQTIKEEAAVVGLSDVVLQLSIDDVELQDPQTEIVDPTPFPTIDITSSPSASPVRSSPPPHRCDDSPFKIKVQYNNKTKFKTCEWVSRHPNWKCQLDGVSTHCPGTCGSCGTCSDSTSRFLVTALTDGMNDDRNTKSCEWVARKNTEYRCSIPGISETCRSTCGNCCSDSPNEFSFLFKGKQLTKTCEWVAKFNTEERCGVSEASYNCPRTCGICCTDSSEVISFLTLDGNPLEKTCEWVGRFNTEGRCGVSEVALNCPRTCNSCCSDVPYEFSFVFNGNQVKKSCEWVARFNTEERCLVPEVSLKCLRTCGNCCIDSTDKFSFQYKDKIMNKSCVWAARRNTETRCREIPEVLSNCKRTCNACS
jgi:hypothetical protein